MNDRNSLSEVVFQWLSRRHIKKSVNDAFDGAFSIGTDIGYARAKNEDCAVVMHIWSEGSYLGLVAVVADGIGGLTDGDIASKYAIAELAGYLSVAHGTKANRIVLRDALVQVNEKVYKMFRGESGTTISVVWLKGKNITVASVGDSPVYAVDRNERKLVLWSRIDTLRGALELKNVEVKISSANSRHMDALLQHIGMKDKLEPNISVYSIIPEVLLLATDGIHSILPQQILMLLKNSEVLTVANRRLLNSASWLGGHDNVSTICLVPKTESTNPISGSAIQILDSQGEMFFPLVAKRDEEQGEPKKSQVKKRKPRKKAPDRKSRVLKEDDVSGAVLLEAQAELFDEKKNTYTTIEEDVEPEGNDILRDSEGKGDS